VINMEGKVLSQFTVKHSADGITLLVRRLAKFGEPIDIPIGIERPDGRLVDLLLEAGHPVVPVSPNAIKTWREGEVLSGAKSDAADAAVIAEYLRLRRHRLTVAAPYSSETKAVRTVVRTRDDLVAMRVAAVNQLAALLDAHWPGAKAIFADLESKIALELLSRYPTPSAAAHLGEKRIAGFCAAHGYSGLGTRGSIDSMVLTELAWDDRPPPPASRSTRRPGSGRRSKNGQHRSQEPRPIGRRPSGSTRTGNLHVAAKVGSDQRRPDARRVGRCRQT
jgi:hypothetical protein